MVDIIASLSYTIIQQPNDTVYIVSKNILPYNDYIIDTTIPIPVNTRTSNAIKARSSDSFDVTASKKEKPAILDFLGMFDGVFDPHKSTKEMKQELLLQEC
ncbi:hypothetical protein NHP164001_16040 [Helicobacter trogontum]|uniref:Uncharacterized protein n=1 Tax=Helicobacter trogontum TaxID=50960 RepID=A0ABQ0D5G0_9HELI